DSNPATTVLQGVSSGSAEAQLSSTNVDLFASHNNLVMYVRINTSSNVQYSRSGGMTVAFTNNQEYYILLGISSLGTFVRIQDSLGSFSVVEYVSWNQNTWQWIRLNLIHLDNSNILLLASFGLNGNETKPEVWTNDLQTKVPLADIQSIGIRASQNYQSQVNQTWQFDDLEVAAFESSINIVDTVTVTEYVLVNNTITVDGVGNQLSETFLPFPILPVILIFVFIPLIRRKSK
ncbi:MAG: hypothetical protein OEY49_15150, partial [Candidatus Heimdallarchaeota archaeon]|nr:hypothetical protein [Candidatus Heimdallarchaeota archaeon]